MGGPWNTPNTDSEIGRARWLAKGNPEETSQKSGLNCHESLTLSEPVHVSIHTYFFAPSKHFTHFTTSHLYVEIRSYTAGGPGPSTGDWFRWPSGQDSVLTALAWLQSLSGNRSPASSSCGNLTSVFLPFSYAYPCSLIEVLAQFCICRSWLLTSTVLIIVHLLYTPILQLGKLKPCVWNSKRFCVRRSWLKFWFL